METKWLSAYIKKIETVSEGNKLSVVIPDLNPNDAAMLWGYKEKTGFMTFVEKPMTEIKLPDIAPEVTDSKKTKSQRLRAVLFILYKQQGSQGEFETFYNTYMEKFIDHIKDKLDSEENEEGENE
jgi:hypothetical protein